MKVDKTLVLEAMLAMVCSVLLRSFYLLISMVLYKREATDWADFEVVFRIKPWPNGLKRTPKSAQVLDLRSTCVSFSHPLVSTCIDLRRLWSSSNLDASSRKFFSVLPPSASRHKLIASNLLLLFC